MDKKENKNALLAGLINVLIPGSSELYVNRDWGRFIQGFIIGVPALLVANFVGGLIQHTKGYTLPQGIASGILVTVVVAILFVSGYRVARQRNNTTNDFIFYNSMRGASQKSEEVQYAEIQKMRDEGLISEQDYEKKKAKVAARK